MKEAIKLHMVCISPYNDRHPVLTLKYQNDLFITQSMVKEFLFDDMFFLRFSHPVVLNEPLRFGSFLCFSRQVKEST